MKYSTLPDVVPRGQFQLRRQVGDGHCLFCSLLCGVGENVEHYEALRQELTELMIRNPKYDLIGGGYTIEDWATSNLRDIVNRRRVSRSEANLIRTQPPLHAYTWIMRNANPCEYGTLLELKVFAHFRHTNVIVFIEDGNNYKKWVEEIVDNNEGTTTPIVCLLYDAAVIGGHSLGGHYDVLQPMQSMPLKLDTVDNNIHKAGSLVTLDLKLPVTQAQSTVQVPEAPMASSNVANESTRAEPVVAVQTIPIATHGQVDEARGIGFGVKTPVIPTVKEDVAEQVDSTAEVNLMKRKYEKEQKQAQRWRMSNKKRKKARENDCAKTAARRAKKRKTRCDEEDVDVRNETSAEAKQCQDWCDNCRRQQFGDGKYKISFEIISIVNIRRLKSPLAKVQPSSDSSDANVFASLCSECSHYLRKTPEISAMTDNQKKHLIDWRYSWPSFVWDMLAGEQATDGCSFFEVYGDYLWKMVPESIRRYWLHENGLRSVDGCYSNCDETIPPSFFTDRTSAIDTFFDRAQNGGLEGFLSAVKNTDEHPSAILPDVLCPWGCTEFCFQAKHCNFGLMIQQHLRKVVLNFPHKEMFGKIGSVETARWDYFRDEYEMVLLDEKWKIRPAIVVDPDEGLKVLTCRYHGQLNVTKYLYLHPPRKPHHNLSAEQSDQLSPCVIQPRTCRSMRAGVYNTSFTMTTQQASYSGVDSMNVTTEGRFSKHSIMLADHEALSVACRDDINVVLSRLVKEGVVTPQLAADIRACAVMHYPPGSTDNYVQGATYVSLEDAMTLQNDISKDNEVAMLIQEQTRKGVYEERLISCRRSWSRIINFLQREDSLGYGYPLTPTGKYDRSRPGSPTMMLWTLGGCILGCKELWMAIDQKCGPFAYNEWEGFLLTHLQCNYIGYESVAAPKNSPFKPRKCSGNQAMLDVLASYAPSNMTHYDGTASANPQLFFKFGIEYWRALFPRTAYPFVSIHSSVDEATTMGSMSESKILIVVDFSPQCEDRRQSPIFIGGSAYELRVATFLMPHPAAENTGHFDAVRYARHGRGFRSYWCQLRKGREASRFMTQCPTPHILREIPVDCFARVFVYVKLEASTGESFKLDFHRLLGGQLQAFCTCNNFPLIVTGRQREDKRECMVTGCRHLEAYICANVACNTRVCKKCFDGLPKGVITSFSPLINEKDDGNGAVRRGKDTGNGNVQNASDSDDDVKSDDESTHGFNSDRMEEDIDNKEPKDTERSLRECVLAHHRDFATIGEGESDVGYFEPDDFFVEDYLMDANINPMDNQMEDADISPLTTDAGNFPYTTLPRNTTISVPCHVLLNQVGQLCTRYNRRITGTQAQLHFVQRLVSTICGTSFPLAYPMAACFPRHFYARARHDPCAILGAMPLSCYTNRAHQHGFASMLDSVRMLLTHASSSTSTDPNLAAFGYDMLCNRVAGGVDSRVVARQGFMVNTADVEGISVREPNRSDLTESVDSHQAAIDLAATQKTTEFDWFFTFTPNQRYHPGICHLYEHKESMAWTKFIPRYDSMPDWEREEVKRSFEQAYGTVLARCWLEVSRLWLEFIMHNASKILNREMDDTFWRYEYQDEMKNTQSGNLPHIHGLAALKRKDLDNEEMERLIYDLQKCYVGNLFPADKIQEYIDEGLFESTEDFVKYTELGDQILTHKKCSNRCLMRVSDGDGPEAFRCRKIDPAKDSIRPLEHDFKEFRVNFSPTCLSILEEIGLYTPPTPEHPRGVFEHRMFVPTRHIGRIKPTETGNMSPVISKFFAATKSSQNAQVITGTNGCAKYVVKYVTALDQGHRDVVWADPHSGAVFRVEKQFLHNTKIARSRRNEEGAFQQSRSRNHPIGRGISNPEIIQQSLGYPDVFQTFNYCHIDTIQFELRRTTKIALDRDGQLLRPDKIELSDVLTTQSVSDFIRQDNELPIERQITPSQRLLYRHSGVLPNRYDKVTQFGMRPVELLEVFSQLGNYFRWFDISSEPLEVDLIAAYLVPNIEDCRWVDSLGRHVLLRRNAFEEVGRYLATVDVSCFAKAHSQWVYQKVLSLVQNKEIDPNFVQDDRGKKLPTIVFSSVTPDHPIPFLLHMLLSLGHFETELDLKLQRTMRESFVTARLIGPGTDEASLVQYSRQLTRRAIEDVVSVQPISLTRLGDYVVATKRIFDGILLRNEIATDELPPCILTHVLDVADAKLRDFWVSKKTDQLAAIYDAIPDKKNYPAMEEVTGCPLDWDLLAQFPRLPDQTDASYDEQKLVVEYGQAAVNKYTRGFGPDANLLTKNVIIYGVPGSGKTYLMQLLGLYAMTKGLRVMSTALMATRASMIGGIHWHLLLGWTTMKNLNPYRMAELAEAKLRRKANIRYLHAVLTMDVLLIDEAGQFSATEFAGLDILLRSTRGNKLPFGGVLLLLSMDPAQFGPINGMPLLVSSHILTSFLLLRLRHSVRAHGDPNFQAIQNITRMSPSQLLADPSIKERFAELMRKTLTFVDSWDDPSITADVQRVFSKRKPAQEARNQYVEACIRQFRNDGTPFLVCDAEDFQQRAGCHAEFVAAISPSLIVLMNEKLKEPPRLVFWRGAQFEATVNGKDYSQSQLLIMLDMPSRETVDSKAPILLLAAPSRQDQIDLREGIPSEEELIQRRWKRVRIGVTPQRNISQRGILGYRKQYALTHIGSSTINKQTGNTITGRCAIEVTSKCHPWESPQVVVMLSRTTVGPDTMLVGSQEASIERIWNIITTGNQWTPYIEMLLDRLTVNATDPRPGHDIMDYAEAYPYSPCNAMAPNDQTGFVYLLVSIRDVHRTYVGECDNLAVRFKEHQSGYGAQGTAEAVYRPYCLAAYMAGLSHLDRSQRRELEHQWKQYIVSIAGAGYTNIFSRIDQGERIVEEYNSGHPEDEHIRFVITLRRRPV